MLGRRGFLQGMLAVGVGVLAPGGPGRAAEPLEAVVLADAATGQPLVRRGACARPFTPASTFKVPLALMGFDAGILQDAHHPAWEYRPEFQAQADRDKKTVDPTTWLRDSVVWYSQQVTRQLGLPRFQGYVDLLDYGNRDLSGDPGKGDGLTRAWLSSSLAISPDDQVRFVRRMLKGEFRVSQQARARTLSVMPVFEAGDGWRVYGKTGTGNLRDATGTLDPERPVGWFVGWARRGERCLAFARLQVPTGRSEEPMGPRVRAGFLRDLPRLVQGAEG